MSDTRTSRIILLAGLHPLIAEDSRLLVECAPGSDKYEAVVSGTDEHTLLPVVNRLKPHVVLLDLLHTRSLHTIQRITGAAPSCSVVAVTGMRNRDHAAAAFSSGASGILYRADLSTELLDALHAVTSGRRFLSSALSSTPQTAKDASHRPPAGGLSSMDELIMRLTLRGYPASRIARALGLSANTVRLSIHVLKQFYGARTKQELKDHATAMFCRS